MRIGFELQDGEKDSALSIANTSLVYEFKNDSLDYQK